MAIGMRIGLLTRKNSAKGPTQWSSEDSNSEGAASIWMNESANDEAVETSIFLSHNKLDAGDARGLGGHLQLVGASVWLDEWEIQPGDSIPGKLNEGLERFDVFLVLWSAHAAGSRWVRSEIESAIHAVIADPRR
jgi:hypothetical protein